MIVYAEVQDLEDSLSRAEALGATIQQPPYEVPGVTIAVVSDPQGNLFGLAQPQRSDERTVLGRPERPVPTQT